MPDHEDSLGGETFSGEEQQDPAEQSLGDGATMGGDTSAHSLGDQSTFGDAHVDDDLFDDGMKLEDLSERYTEEGVLGKGGMGEVILATDTRLGRKVAIKRILGKAARSKTAVARFLTEAKSMAELNHTNIVQIYDYGRATDGPFLIMECVQGGSLLEKCKAGPIELDEAVNIFGQLCDGLAKAHAVGIIHRDIKPANVLMTDDGIPKLTDFGLAKDDTADTGMTMEGAVIGTLDFMPPEQRHAAELTDHRSDHWSLAATFYQMLTGEPPRVIDLDLLPPSIRPVLAKALKSKKEDRFQSAMEMREAILQAHSGKMDRTRTLGEGECPQCATPNPSEGKFCVECSAVLQVKCLKCESEIPIWNKACGECGVQQTPLVDKALADLKQIHDEAESLLTDLEFEGAVKKAEDVASETDSRLQQYATWHEEFLVRIESSRTSVHARLAQLLQEALVHEQAYDYEAGLQTLRQVAPSLNQTTVSENDDTAEVLTERLTTKQSRVKELKGIIRERVTNRVIAGLRPIVNELLTLKPDRADLIKLQNQLVEKEESIATRNQDTVVKAKQYMSSLRFSEVISALKSISEIERTDEIKSLIEQAENYYQQREVASLALEEAEGSRAYVTAIKSISYYLSEIAKADIKDLQLQQMLDMAKDKASVANRKKVLVTMVTAVACIVVVLITGVVIKINNDAKAVETAILNLDWETVLELDSDNAEGLRLKAARDKAVTERAAAAEKSAKITAALAQGDWKTVLALAPDNSDGLRMQAASEKVAAAEIAAAAEKAAILAGEPITNRLHMTFNNIPAGTFTMGSRDTEKDRREDETQHKVTISKSFYMQTTEVTQEQWTAVMATEPWEGKSFVKEGPSYAASYVNWDDAIAYCKKLSEKEGKTYRLPTEAEWEYACRAGTETRWSFGDDEKVLGNYAWYTKNAWDIDEKYAHQVELKKPNAFGLYDMHGNVFEWCYDYHGKDYYKESSEKDPPGPASGSSRVLRGGSWFYDSRGTRSANRGRYFADHRSLSSGFRLVRELDDSTQSAPPTPPISVDPPVIDLPSITNTLGMKLKLIPSGTFMVGSPTDEIGRYDREQQHKVTITKAFYMQATEVTQGQWTAVMGTGPWKGKHSVKEGPNYVASYVSWDDAIAYCKKLSEKEKQTYRLPTEAEWEYACRAGTNTARSFGDDEMELGDYAWYEKNAMDIGEEYAHQVGLKKPNAFGLYDMHGNVNEWCHDYYGVDYYERSPEQDPRGPASGSFRVLRGGSWNGSTRSTRSAFRSGFLADSRNFNGVGFRLVRELDDSTQSAPPTPFISVDPPVTDLPSITNSIDMTFNKLHAGTFLMGSPETERDREDIEDQHKVTITKAFYMQTTAVTQGQWKAVMGTEPWKGQEFSKCVKEGPNYPAVYVSWDDAVAYCKKLSTKEGKTYRLPTEPEWEYACRAGTETRWSFGNDENKLGDYAWWSKNASDLVSERYAHQVGQKKPNAFGLYDMHGNVFEWCHDYFEEDYYKLSPEKDPTGPTSAPRHVLRGGSWFSISRNTRSARRSRFDAGFRNCYLGFRVVRELD